MRLIASMEKLANGSPLLDTEVYQHLQDVHRRLKMQEEPH